MQHPTSNIAILLFSKFSYQDIENHKSFLGKRNKDENHQVATVLFDYTLQLIQKTNLPFFWIDAHQQRGNSFGEKISNALQEVFQKGFQKVIAIGDDCPTLSFGDFQKTISAFQQNQNVIGFAQDGGAYLIGMDKADFQQNTFALLPWQTEHLGETLAEYLQANQKPVFFLTPKADVDNAQDWAKAFAHLPFYSLFKRLILKALVFQITFNNIPIIPFSQPYYHLSQSLRAPPFFE